MLVDPETSGVSRANGHRVHEVVGFYLALILLLEVAVAILDRTVKGV